MLRVARAIAVDHSVPRAVAGRGAMVLASDGRWYVDMTSGVGCLAVGHSHPRVVEAVSSQLAHFTHTDYSVIPYTLYEDVCDRLCRLVPLTGAKAALFNSGAEAVENAVKIARFYTRKPDVVAFEGAFHGRTYMALSLTDRGAPVKSPDFGPFFDVLRAPYPYDTYGFSDALWCVEEHLRRGTVACVVVEPVLGEGGVVIPPPEFLRELRRACDWYGSLLVVDEIQTGFGRTGTMWGFERSGITPDLVVIGKSIAAGMPLSAVVGRASLMDSVPPGGLGGTYIGNPLSCAAALAVMDVFEDEKLLERAVRIEQVFREELRALDGSPLVGGVRGLGAMFGIVMRNQDCAADVIRRARIKGVWLLPGGVHRDVVRMLPPLVIPEPTLRNALRVVVEEVIKDAEATAG